MGKTELSVSKLDELVAKDKDNATAKAVLATLRGQYEQDMTTITIANESLRQNVMVVAEILHRHVETESWRFAGIAGDSDKDRKRKYSQSVGYSWANVLNYSGLYADNMLCDVMDKRGMTSALVIYRKRAKLSPQAKRALCVKAKSRTDNKWSLTTDELREQVTQAVERAGKRTLDKAGKIAKSSATSEQVQAAHNRLPIAKAELASAEAELALAQATVKTLREEIAKLELLV